jgi:MFS family permease
MPKPETKVYSRKHLITGSFICAVGALFYCYEFILRIIPGILQEEIRIALGNLSASTFSQIAALYYLAYSPMQLPVGILIDRFGPRYLLSLACLCCSIGSFLFSDTSLVMVGLGRLLVGFGSAFAFVGLLSAAVNWLPERYFSFVAGMMTTLSMFGLILGEIHITRLANNLGLHKVLVITAIVGLILASGIFIIVRDSPVKRKHHSTPYSIFLKQVLQVFRSPYIWIIGIMGTCLYTSLSVFGELWGKSFLEISFHLSKTQAAQTTSALFLGWALGAPLCGYFSDRSGERLRPIILGAIGAIICISIILYCPSLSYRSLNLLVFGYGACSSIEIIVFIMAKEYSVNQELSGTIFAVTNMIISLGGMILQPLVGFLLDWSSPHSYLHFYSAKDYRFGLSILIISLLIVIVIAARLSRNVPSRTKNSN